MGLDDSELTLIESKQLKLWKLKLNELQFSGISHWITSNLNELTLIQYHFNDNSRLSAVDFAFDAIHSKSFRQKARENEVISVITRDRESWSTASEIRKSAF